MPQLDTCGENHPMMEEDDGYRNEEFSITIEKPWKNDDMEEDPLSDMPMVDVRRTHTRIVIVKVF